jgi:sugar O-acyltransferase (sialic acid O-acetyltransferase NeuD family)
MSSPSSCAPVVTGVADVVIFGAGDIARLAHYYFSTDSEHRVVAFVVDREFRKAESFQGLPLVDFEQVDERFPPSSCRMFVALSYARMNQARARAYKRARDRGYALVSYVSSRCTNLAQDGVGDNCFILEDNTIQPFVRIGSNVTLWSGNHIGHDSTIENHVFVSSHVVISGHVRIGEYSFLGVNATLRNGISVAPRTLIGAGAVIMGDTVEGGVYVGRPSQRIEKTSDQIDL